jgi:hypothetical protein
MLLLSIIAVVSISIGFYFLVKKYGKKEIVLVDSKPETLNVESKCCTGDCCNKETCSCGTGNCCHTFKVTPDIEIVEKKIDIIEKVLRKPAKKLVKKLAAKKAAKKNIKKKGK